MTFREIEISIWDYPKVKVIEFKTEQSGAVRQEKADENPTPV